MKYLITGGCGFVGSNLAAKLLASGGDVAIFDNLSREGCSSNLAWLHSLGNLEFIHGDIRNANDVDHLLQRLQPGVIFHLSGQVAMTTSMLDPRKDFEINVLGSLNLLESARSHCRDATIIYSSSNKAYGNLGTIRLAESDKRYIAPEHPEGIDETMPLDFHTPYGCSKGAADQYMLDYSRSFGMNTVVFRHSTIYGGRQFATFEQGWVGWFCAQALEVKRDPDRQPFTIAGDGKQVRDLLYVDDAVDCYLAAARSIDRARGQAFNIGGGMANSCSLLELFDVLESVLNVRLRYTRLPWRHDDQKIFVADCGKALRLLQWSPQVSREQGIRRTLDWLRQDCSG